MITPQINLVINQGATFRYKFLWETKAGRPVNITGYTARAHIRSDVNAPTPLIELTTENGGIVLDAKQGAVTLLINSLVTQNFAWHTGVYDVELIAPSGEVSRLVMGDVCVSPEVTR